MNYAKHLESFSSRNVDQVNCLATTCSEHLWRMLSFAQHQFFATTYYFFFFFFGGSSSELLLSVLLLLLLEELESDSNSEEEVVLLEDGDDEEVEELSSLSLSSSEEEVEESSLSDDESLAELTLLLLLELVTLLDLFFLVFLSAVLSPALCCNNSRFSFSFRTFANWAVLEGLCRYFLFPVHSYVQCPNSKHFWHLTCCLFASAWGVFCLF